MRREKVVFWAALVRIFLALFACLLLPLLYPRLAAQRPILAAYVGATLVMQLLIWKEIGGQLRSFISGIIDLAILTFIVHRVGSIATMMVSLYLLSGVMNALVVSQRVGMSLALLGGLFYSSLLAAERVGWLPYGPDAPAWSVSGRPDTSAVVTAAILLSLLLPLCSFVVGLLVQTIRAREAALTQANAQLEELSQRDPLTQLYNRRHLLARVEAELARVKRGRPFALVMIDLDNFKQVNDSNGHLHGDSVLQDIARALDKSVRVTDVTGRYGGDEFLVLLPDTEREQALAVADRLAASARTAGEGSRVTASVGVAMAASSDDVASLVRRADEHAYRAKQAGGSRVSAE